MISNSISRRSLLAAAAAAPFTSFAAGKPPIGLELYSVRNELMMDPPGTVRRVAKMGYEVVEFYSPYYQWTKEQATEMRKLLDDLGIRCLSTHNGPISFSEAGIGKAIELNQIIGAKYIVMASAGRVQGLDGWKKQAEILTQGAAKMKAAGLLAGYHNHAEEFKVLEGKRPMEIIAANTPKDFALQLDVGTCVEMGSDPVAWIESNPGRIASMHVKDWSSQDGYKVLLGEGSVPWKKVFAAAEKVGGLQYYLIEQEGSAFPPFETAEKCLANYRKIASS